MMQQSLRASPAVKKRAKSVYQQRNLGTIKKRKKEKQEEKQRQGHTHLEPAFEPVGLVVVHHRPVRGTGQPCDALYVKHAHTHRDWGNRSAVLPPSQWSTVRMSGYPCLSAKTKVREQALRSHCYWTKQKWCTYIPNSETNRPARMSQLCHGSCEPCQTFPARVSEHHVDVLLNPLETYIGAGHHMSCLW